MRTAVLAAAIGYCGCAFAQSVPLEPSRLPRVGEVDARYQSYNVEMAAVIGAEFWKPYGAGGTVAGQGLFQARPPVDLSNTRLRRLAAALGPAFVRVSGTWANSVYFDNSDAPAPPVPPAGFRGVLTRPQWQGVIDFARAVDAQLVTSFAISAGVRDAAGVWTPRQARARLAFTHAAGGQIAAAEFFNEPTMPELGGAPAGYDAKAYARDFALFHAFARKTDPGMRIVGPAAVGEEGMPVSAADLLAADPRSAVDVFSYHFYGALSLRCAAAGTPAGTTAAAALSPEWLARTDRSFAFHVALRDAFAPGRPIWVTETADAACGGNPWAATFADSFRYLDQLGRLARLGASAVFHNTLAVSDYGLLEEGTLRPRPNYWAALLWRRLMGTTVLDAGPRRSGLHLYAHCLRDRAGGVALLAINTDHARTESIALPIAAQRYTLTAPRLEASQVLLNGVELGLGKDDALPALAGAPTPAGTVALAPESITFLAVAEAGNQSCAS